LIHPSASVDSDAEFGANVSVGAWSLIEAGVQIGEGTTIGPHVVIRSGTRIGRDNRIYQFCSIGDAPQDKKYDGTGPSRLEIGDRNTIREYCSINRGTPSGGGLTRVGNDNWIMAYCHVAHDCTLGNQTVLANNATLAGHVALQDCVTLGGFSGVHQFCRIGAYSFTGIAAVVVKDVPPFLIASGNTARAYGLNREGLKRNGFTREAIDSLRQAYRILYRQQLTLTDALARLEELAPQCRYTRQLVDFIKESKRGIIR
jgi:UDP-N-acetylglucosamine acyltransferase